MRSLQTRLMATYVALALVLLVAAGWLFSTAFIDYAESVREQRIVEMVQQATMVVNQSAKQPEVLLADLQKGFPDLEFTFVQVIFASRTLAPSRDVLAPRLLSFLLPSGERFSAYPIAYAPGGLPIGSFLAEPKERGGLLFRTFYREVVLIVMMGVGLAALLGWWFSRWLSRPVTHLTQATAAVAEGDFLQTVKPTGTPELDDLVQQFNRMVQRLNESFRTISSERDVARRFASDAAHELKTPLTALKAYHETVSDRPERLAQVLPGMGRSIDRIEGIIAGLLQLARLSEGTGLELAPGDLAETLCDLEPGFRAMAREAGHSLELSGADAPLSVRLDRRLLEIALTNLVGNACKFTPAGGRIGIALGQEGTEAVITVSDTGPGIPDNELAHIFERFHRGANTQAIPGSGLGLSIVQEAVGRMGGRVTVESEVGRGSCFALRLPIA